MPQYIDKAALVAEIESLRRTTFTNFDEGVNATVQTLLEVVDTLEVKEVDLEKVIDGLTAGWIEGEEYGELQNINTCRCITLGEVKEAMCCMFELGLKTQKGE